MNLQTLIYFGEYSIDKGADQKVEEEKNYLVVSYKLITKRDDNSFHPTTTPKIDYMEVTVNSKDSPNYLYEWFVSNSFKNGKIEFTLLGADEIKPRVLIFENAQCFSLEESYNKDLNQQRQLTLKITMGNMLIDGCTFKK